MVDGGCLLLLSMMMMLSGGGGLMWSSMHFHLDLTITSHR
jgi:hypothetical protein